MSEFPCPFCEAPIAAADVCPRCAKPLILCARYRPIALLGRGGMSTIYAATDTQHPEAPLVAIKMLSLGAPAADWKTRELFERSTRVLQDLSHPALPKVHAFEPDDAGRFFLVRDAFDGGTLQERIARDQRHVDEPQLRRLLVALLELLVYLHARLPPIVHRDIKPANIMFRTEGDWNAVLVDFDTVAAPAENRSGMTIIGTPGYAAPEQFVGDSSPSSDLYGLGATMLFVLTHVDADRLPREGGRFAVEDRLASLDPTLAAVLRKMVEPEKSKRYAQASEALDDLRGAPAPILRPMYEAMPNAPLPGTARPGAVRYIAVLALGLGASIAAYGFLRQSPPQLVTSTSTPTSTSTSTPTSNPGEGRGLPPPSTSTTTSTTTSTPTPLPTPASAPDWGFGVCNGVEQCYKATESWGDMSGKISTVIDASGRARSGTYDGNAPYAARKCLIGLAKSRVLTGYSGPGGKLVCTYRGSILEGVTQLMSSGGFKENAPKDAGK